MNENLTNQIVAALIQDGTVKMSADRIRAVASFAMGLGPWSLVFAVTLTT